MKRRNVVQHDPGVPVLPVLLVVLVAALVLTAMAAPAMAAPPGQDKKSNGLTPTIDLSIAGNVVEYQGAIFIQGPLPVATGTGTFSPFVRTSGQNDVQKNYNTDFRPIQEGFDTDKNTQWTHSLQLKDVPIVEYEYPAGTTNYYYEFNGDINQVNGRSLLSIDELRVFTAGPGGDNLHMYNDGTKTFDDPGVAVALEWNLDGITEDAWIKLDYALEAGSGKSDLTVLAPVEFFPADKNVYVIFVTKSGVVYPHNDGFEEWAVEIVEKGSLEVTKDVIWNGVTPDGTTFEICITGPSYPDGDCKTTTGGTLLWEDLVPGEYIVTETSPGSEWEVPVITGSPATVVGDEVATATVTNEHKLGCLSIEKIVNWNGVPMDTDQKFYVDVYTSSMVYVDTLEFDYDGSTECLGDLVPGDYYIKEQSPGPAWDVCGDGVTVTVVAGDECPCCSAFATITNTHKLGCLEVTKIVDWGMCDENEAQTFEVCITGPSYPGGSCKCIDFDGGTVVWEDLIPGEYTVSETDPGSAWMVCIDGSPVTVEPDGDCAEATVTNTYVPATIGDFVWEDMDADGIQDAGEPGVAGVQVTLFDGSSMKVAETATDANGYYLFNCLKPGSYYLNFDLPDGWRFSPANQGADDAKDSDADPYTGDTTMTTLSAGETDLTWDAGMFKPVDICVRKFQDDERDKTYDGDEELLEGWEIKLWTGVDGPSEVIACGLTDCEGMVCFTDLEPGKYWVSETIKGGWYPTNIDFQVDSLGVIYVGVLLSGDEATVDFGNFQPVKVCAYKFEDVNENGIREPCEQMLEGWKMTLWIDDDDCDGKDAPTLPVAWGYTDENGKVCFDTYMSEYMCGELLMPGKYWLSEDIQEGWVPTNADLIVDSLAIKEVGVLIPGQLAKEYFGNYYPRNEWCGYTIGFWKNNIYKYNEEWTNGRQVPDWFFEGIDPCAVCMDVDPAFCSGCCGWEHVYGLIADYDASDAQEKAVAQMLAMKLTELYVEGDFGNYVIDYNRYKWYDCDACGWVYEDCYWVLKDASKCIGGNPMNVGDLWELIEDLYCDKDYSAAQELADCINNYKWGCEDYDGYDNGVICTCEENS